jgi:hypothetical protein
LSGNSLRNPGVCRARTLPGKLAILLSKENTCVCGQNGAILVRDRNLIAKPCSNKWMPDEENNPPAHVLLTEGNLRDPIQNRGRGGTRRMA